MLARRLPSILPPLLPGRGARGDADPERRRAARRGRHRARAAVPRAAPHDLGGRPGRRRPAAVARRGDARPPRRAVPRRAVGVRPPLARGAAPAARGRARVDRARRTASRASRRASRWSRRRTRVRAAAAGRRCRCGEADLQRHPRRLSGPLLDRIDLLVGVERPSTEDLAAEPVATSAAVRAQVLAARERQAVRGVRCNAELRGARLRAAVAITAEARDLLDRVYDHGDLSARGRDRALRVARTVADLEGAARVDARAPARRARLPPAGRGARAGRRHEHDRRVRRLRAAQLAGRAARPGISSCAAPSARCIREVLALADARLIAALGGLQAAAIAAGARGVRPGRAARRVGRRRHACDLPPPRAATRPPARAARRSRPCCTCGRSASGCRELLAAAASPSSVRARHRRRHVTARGARPRALGRRRDGRQRHGARHRLRRARGRARRRRRTRSPSSPAARTCRTRAAGAACTSGSARGRPWSPSCRRAPRRTAGRSPPATGIIAALAQMIVVVEAAERSGSLITADIGISLGPRRRGGPRLAA